MKAEAEPIRAISHIQKTAPAPPIAIAEATPAKLPVPTLDAVPIQNAWNEETCPLLFSFESSWYSAVSKVMTRHTKTD